MSGDDSLSAGQFSHDRNIMCQVTAHLPTGEAETFHTRGSGITQERHPGDVPEPLYHGSYHRFAEGELVEPGHPGNYVSRMKHVYATTDPGRANHYAHAGRIYEVEPTGWYGHRRDARGADYASDAPMKVKREIDYDYDPEFGG